MIDSKQKGKRGELELSSILRGYGFSARRSVQYSGANGDADVVGLPKIHIECKRVERLNVQEAYEQSQWDALDDEIPVVIHRRNHCNWLVTLSLADWIEMYKEWINK